VLVRRIPYDVQRDMSFYRTVVGFRNGVERMRMNHGELPDWDHVFWGFGGSGGGQPGGDDGLAGSRIPRRPYGGSGAAGVGLVPPEQLDWDEAAEDLSRLSRH
jgi:hypothetical protein